MQYALAPMEGVTGAVFRTAHHRLFGGVDRYFMPFITPTSDPKFTPRQLRELAPANNAGLCAVPQLLTKSADDFLWAARALAEMGYSEVNLNLGCPSGTVVAKGKGAGFLAHPEALGRFLDAVFAAAPLSISVKTRLGMQDPAEFDRLLSIFNQYPIAQLIVHPRVRTDFYRGRADQAAFAAALAQSRNPVCYNGDLFTPADCRDAAARFPSAAGLMLGRGLVADPALARKAQGGPPAGRDEMQAFHDALYAGYCAAFGNERNAVMRMKELWSYQIHLFQHSEKYGKQLRKAATPRDFLAQSAAIFRDLPLCTDLPAQVFYVPK